MKTILLAGVLALGAVAANAATLNFDLRDGDRAYNQTALDYKAGDVSLQVTGMVCDDDRGPNHSSCTSGLIDRSQHTGIFFAQPHDSSHAVDGKYTNEFLKLSFNPSITLNSITFSYWDKNDNARVYNLNGSRWRMIENISTGSAFNYTFDFDKEYTGAMFLVGATQDNDEWKLREISVDYTPGGTLPPVPLPAAGWMLLAGLGGLGAMKRRKKAA